MNKIHLHSYEMKTKGTILGAMSKPTRKKQNIVGKNIREKEKNQIAERPTFIQDP